jgi:hypothetical protein
MPLCRTFSIVVVLLACVLSSCALQEEEISQTVRGRLDQESSAASGTIKVLSSRNGDCTADGVTSDVNGDGEFVLTRTVVRGRVAVIVQHDLICYRNSGGWEVVWQSRAYGPAAEYLAVECTRTALAWKCRVMTNWGTEVANEG